MGGNRTSGIPDVVWAPLAAGVLLGVVGLISWALGQPWLFPSLGPTAYLQTESPDRPMSRFYNTVVGHLMGLGAGFLSIFLFGLQHTPLLTTTHAVTLDRMGAAVISVTLTMLGCLLFRASHPPAAATTLLIALGGFRPTPREATNIAIGVLIVATVGEFLRRLRAGAR